jgi:hypothetical protein
MSLKDPEVLARYEESQGALERIHAVHVMQEELKQLPQVQEVFDAIHHFSPGIYTRECHIPADTFVIGKTHRHAHPTFMTKGKCKMWDVGAGTPPEIMEAPRHWTSVPGAKRVLYALEDCVFFTCHASEETDLEVLEDQLIVPESEAMQLTIQQLAALPRAGG